MSGKDTTPTPDSKNSSRGSSLSAIAPSQRVWHYQRGVIKKTSVDLLAKADLKEALEQVRGDWD